MHDLRTSVYRHLQRLSLAFFTKTRTGEVQSRIANDIGGVDNVLTSTATSVMSTITTVIATVIAMFLLSWQLALIALALMPIFVVITRRVGAARRKIVTTRQESMADISSLVQESLSVSGILLGKTMGRSGELAERFEGESSRLADLEVRSRMTGRWMMQSIQMTFAIMPAAIYWFGGLAVHNEGPTASYAVVGTLVAFTTLQTRLFAPIGSLLSISVDVQSSLALFDRIFEYLDLPVDIAPGHADARARSRRRAHRRRLVPLRRRARTRSRAIDVDDPGGNHDGDRRRDRRRQDDARLPRLAPLRPERRAGSRSTASTSATSPSSRSRPNVGVVSQETYLFHATVRENLRFAKPDATDEEIEEAARAAQIHNLISSLPDGYETVVGERGYRFSGGEKQRIAIARAVLRNPPILVLDEATSALDTQTERAVQEALAPARRGAHDDRDRPPALDRSATPTRSSCSTTAAWSRPARYDELVARGGRFAALAARDFDSFDAPEGLAELV